MMVIRISNGPGGIIRYDRSVITVAPEGKYGFGKTGPAHPETTISQAWTALEEAGIASQIDRQSGRVVTAAGPSSYVEFRAKPGINLDER